MAATFLAVLDFVVFSSCRFSFFIFSRYSFSAVFNNPTI
jgi:hypothetical protein